ncbi:MAG: LL-diaminopimelate aminotransferase [Hydrogenoanaerobacterium sp.]
MRLNKNFENLTQDYLFYDIAKKVSEYTAENPTKKLIRLGIGDVTLPLPMAAVAAMQAAVAQMSSKASFRGYGPKQGYDFLREGIAGYYESRGTNVPLDDIFINDGSKSAIGGLSDLFDENNTVLIPSPVYPAYVDTSIISGRKIVYLAANKDNGFLPMPNDNIDADIIYICSPNNPTGAAYNKGELQKWVNYAIEKSAVIIYDAAYEAFITEENLPRSIYEIVGAESCAIELCSFSKMAGFTGTRCGWTVVPQRLNINGVSLKKLWQRRQAAKFNGVSYIIQRGAAAVLTEAGMSQVKANLGVYRKNASIITNTLRELDISFSGGKNSPYIWLRCPQCIDSWSFFDKLLNECGVVGTPGIGFGKCGEGYLRLTAFGDKAATELAMRRIAKLYNSNMA